MRSRYIQILLILTLAACSPVTRLNTGDEAFEYKRYPLAVTLFEEEIERTKLTDEQARKSFLIGESYRLMNNDASSIPWYRKAYEISRNQISLEAYANAVLRNQQYSNARKLYSKLIQDFGTNAKWQNAIESCDAAQQWIADQNPNQYVIRRWRLNSAQSDFSPVFYENIIVFSSDRAESTGDEYHWTGQQFTDFYRSRENDRLDALLYSINSPYNEANITFNNELNHVVYTQCGTSNESDLEENCRLIEGFWNDEIQAWANFRTLNFCEEDISYGHPTFFNQDRAIIFSSNDPNGIGAHDLWVSYMGPDDWTQPLLLPQGINTAGNEKFPVMQGDTLYYSSDGKVGMGGLDIYYSRWIEPEGWTAPVNMKPPVNSGGDDFGFTRDATFKPSTNVSNRFFITSNRKGSALDDIYIFEEMVLTNTDSLLPEEPSYAIVIEGKILEHMYEIPGDPNSRKMGTRPLSGASIEIEDQDYYPANLVDETGEFTYTIEREGAFRFKASKQDYLSNSRFVAVELNEDDKRAGGKTYIVHIILDPIVYNKEIVMKDIFYDFDKWNIRSDAEPPLIELADLLTNNPGIQIELASHTDCRGLEIYNAELSQRRAESAVAYLKSLGIEAKRMKAIGYGEQRPAVQCICEACSEEEHQANRRTSFTILKN